MDKRKVINAYRSGIISIQECAQIIGLDSRQLSGLINDVQMPAEDVTGRRGRAVTSITS
ncbi:hypothetical protein [Paenibacillus sp. NEAU-GSW1]|uniref:hypothetical protein n=1 Tax=Paenibacillus sp. NEAU-GSW1 TaxID=2682486 RepID=UPI001563E9E0|nr:hypothetical protein [Paenibacillus sp. NEAU-GSW1]